MKTCLKNSILLLVLITLPLTTLLGGCSTEDDDKFATTLPPITQTGENTFGCYVDGKLLIPRDGNTAIPPNKGMWLSASGEPPNYLFDEINVRDYKSGNGGLVDIHIVELHNNGEGTFSIKESNCERLGQANHSINIRARWRGEETQDDKWYCSIQNGGTLIISRYDFENGIVSGTFSCTMVNRDDPGDFIEITEGRFDINWRTVNYTGYP